MSWSLLTSACPGHTSLSSGVQTCQEHFSHMLPSHIEFPFLYPPMWLIVSHSMPVAPAGAWLCDTIISISPAQLTWPVSVNFLCFFGNIELFTFMLCVYFSLVSSTSILAGGNCFYRFTKVAPVFGSVSGHWKLYRSMKSLRYMKKCKNQLN